MANEKHEKESREEGRKISHKGLGKKKRPAKSCWVYEAYLTTNL
jgi:hypothetical protein